jgi:Nucleotide-diphospho-sugar transferase
VVKFNHDQTSTGVGTEFGTYAFDLINLANSGTVFMTYRGAIYCATDHTIYLEAALISAIAFRQLNPTIPVTILCDRPVESLQSLIESGITPITIPSKHRTGNFQSRNLKTRLASLSPYPETLYIDSDILPLKPIDPIWDYLNQADLAMALDRLPTIGECDHISPIEIRYTLESLPESTAQYNSGVMLWRNNRATQALFRRWQQEWGRFQKHDQLALVRALARMQLSVARLPVNYNISPIDAAPVLLPRNEVYFLHCWGGQVASGEYRRIAQGFYPAIVATVTELLMRLPQDSATPG